jgi:hypothetical protein
MRLRLLLQGRRRGRGLGGLIRGLGAASAALLLLAGCGGKSQQPPASSPSAPATTTAPAPPPAPPEQRLALGLTEANPSLISPGEVATDFPAWRDRVAALRPTYYRVVVDWAKIQPDAGRPPDLTAEQDGCMRGIAPCGPYAGLRAQLTAARDQQRHDGGFAVVVVLQGVPDWADHGPRGCERSRTLPRNRPITRAGLDGYRRLIRDVLALGRELDVPLRWWSPWNEPNHPAFISPQRNRCIAEARTVAPRAYARLARAARTELAAAPGRHDLVLGDLAGVEGPTKKVTGVGEFVDHLPDDVACSAAVWAQHNYAQPGGGAPDAVGELERALARRPCTAGTPIWVTETGVGGARLGRARKTTPAALARQCRSYAHALERWDADPQVTAAFQYTFREDPAFLVGLADPALTRTFPPYELLLAWATARPTDPAPPPRPATC